MFSRMFYLVFSFFTLLNILGFIFVYQKINQTPVVNQKVKEVQIENLKDFESFLSLQVPLEIQFSIPISTKIDANQAFRIYPNIKGQWNWNSKQSVQFTPEEDWPAGYQGIFEITKTYKILEFLELKPMKVYFKMQELEVISCFQKNYAQEPTSEISIGLNFNTKVDPYLLQKYLKISDAKLNNLNFYVITKAASKNIEIGLQEKIEGEVCLKILKDFSPVNGKPFAEEIERKFNVTNVFKINYLKAEFDQNKAYIQVSTNKASWANSIRDNIKISPPIDFTVSNNWYGLRLNGPFVGATKYTITIDKNLSGFNSKKPFVEDFQVIIPDYPPFLNFTDDCLIYGLFGKQTIDLESINVDSVEAILYQIPNYNYNLFLNTRYYNQGIFKEELNQIKKTIPFQLNQNSKWDLNLKDFNKKLSPGFYELELKSENKIKINSDYEWSSYRAIKKKIILTDIGVSCRKSSNGLFFWVNRLSDISPIAKAEIQLFSKANFLLLQSQTDEFGLVNIKVGKEILDKTKFVLIQYGNDVTYLKFQDNLRKFVGEGDNYPTANYQAFLNLERNVFRPGEKIEIDCAVRNKLCEIPPVFPVEIVMKTFEGDILFKKMEKLDNSGCVHTSTTLSENIPGGSYLISVLLADKTIIGQEVVDVASFMPQRLNGKIQGSDEKIIVNKPMTYEIQCEYLTGASGEGLTIENVIYIREKPQIFLNKWEDYKIGFTPKNLFNDTIHLANNTLDKSGKSKIEFVVPKLQNLNAIYEIDLYATILDRGNREYHLAKSQEFLPRNEFLAIKEIEAGAESRSLDIKLINSMGDILPTDIELDWKLHNIEQHWTLVKKNSYYEYEYSEEEVLLFSGKLKIEKGSCLLQIPNTNTNGQILIINDDKNLKANLFINIAKKTVPQNPYEILISNASKVKPGEEVSVDFTVPFLGKGLICMETDEIQWSQIVVFTEIHTNLHLPVPQTARGSVHLTCTLLQSQAALGEQKCYRAFGAIQIVLNHDDKKLVVQADIPAMVHSGTEIAIQSKIVDLNGLPIKQARVLVSVMDKGIQDLNGKYSPDGFSCFYGSHSGVIEEFDFYKDVFPEKINLVENSKPGGGGGAGSVRAEKFVSFKDRIQIIRWQSDPMETNENGEITLKIPKFAYQGKLNIQIWCLKDDQFGSFSKDFFVRDELFVEESFPKFVYSEDQFNVPILLQNLEEKPLTINFELTNSSLISILEMPEKKYEFFPKEKKIINFKCKAKEITGAAEFEMKWVINGKEYKKKIILPVITRKNIVTIVTEGLISENLTKELAIDNSLETDSCQAELLISSTATEQLRGSLDYLITYPYGCGEQTISKLMPLVYSRPILALTDKIHSQNEVDFYINEGANKLQRYQNYDGGICLWEKASEADLFVSAYGCFLFSQLIKNGYLINQTMLSSLLSYLKNKLKENPSMDLKTKCFVIYVLCLHADFQKAELNQLLLSKPKLDRSAACFLYMSALLAGIEMPKWDEFAKDSDYFTALESSGFYSSNARDIAIELLMATDFDLKINKENLSMRLMKIRETNGHWGSSQSNAWCYFALMKYLQAYPEIQKPNWTCDVNLDGVDASCGFEKGGFWKNIKSPQIKLQKKGDGFLYYKLTQKGFPKVLGNESISSVIHVDKKILTLDHVELKNNTKLISGNSYLIKITIKSDTDLESVVIQDFFPSCLEYSYTDKQESAKDPTHALGLFSFDIRDDRMYLFPQKLSAQVNYEYYYFVRCTTAGGFYCPSIKAENMYNASIFGQSKSQMISVIDANP